MQYPLTLTFKTVALNPQIAVTDATGALVLYVRQKAFKLREAVTVFGDREMTRPLFTIGADRVIDFRATYRFTATDGTVHGAVRREGARAIWRSRFEVTGADGTPVFRIQEDNPWTKVLDGLLGEIPVLGALSGYLLHPSYTLSRPDGAPALRLTKQPAFWEGRFLLEEIENVPPQEEVLAVLAVLMMTLLERARG
jgi:hypothetical protein